MLHPPSQGPWAIRRRGQPKLVVPWLHRDAGLPPSGRTRASRSSILPGIAFEMDGQGVQQVSTFLRVPYLPHYEPIPRARPFCRTLDSFQGSPSMRCLGRQRLATRRFFLLKEKYREKISDCSGCNARHGDRRRRRRPPPPTARLSAGSHRQNAHRQGPDRERPDWQGSGTGHFEILNPGLLKPTFNRPAVKGRRTWQTD